MMILTHSSQWPTYNTDGTPEGKEKSIPHTRSSALVEFILVYGIMGRSKRYCMDTPHTHKGSKKSSESQRFLYTSLYNSINNCASV